MARVSLQHISRKHMVIAALSGTSLIVVALVAGVVFAVGPPSHAPVNISDISPKPVLRDVPLADVPTPPLPKTASPSAKKSTPAKPKTVPQYVKDPLSITMVVNKKFQLHSNFAPGDLRAVAVARTFDEPLRQVAANALEKMFAEAKAAGVGLKMNSAYRSFAMQQAVYNQMVATSGVAYADEYSARPGFSEHQSGLAADVIQDAPTTSGVAMAWIAAHSYKYGFIVRYPRGKEAITGYGYEPWHIRYVGELLAGELFATGKTLEEHFNVPGGGYAT